MSFFQKREPPASGPGAELPRAAVCFPSRAMTRRAADWLGNLGGCRPLGIHPTTATMWSGSVRRKRRIFC